MSNARPLTPHQEERLQSGLDFAARIADSARPLSLAQVQALYDAFIDEQVDHPVTIEALGISFGACLIGSGDLLEWVGYEDEYGEEISVAVIGKAIFAHPISMVQKRLEDRKTWDLAELHASTLARLRQMADEDNSDTRKG